MKRIFVFAIVLLVPFIIFADPYVSVKGNTAPTGAADLSVKWTIDVGALTGYKFGFIEENKENINYNSQISSYSGPLTLNTEIQNENDVGEKKYSGVGTVWVYWQIRSSENVKLGIYTNGQMESGSKKLNWSILWNEGSNKATQANTNFTSDSTENTVVTIESSSIIQDSCGTMELNVSTDSTTVSEGDSYSGTIYLKAINS